MNTMIPLDVLVEVAWNLDSISDLRRFRMVNRVFACAGFLPLFRSVHVMNTVECLEKLREIQWSYGSPPSIQHLTLYHGSWPTVSTFDDWSNHPLTLDPCGSSPLSKALAFSHYQQFISREIFRRFDTDVAVFSNLFSMFHNLRSLTITHLHAWRWSPLDNPQYSAFKQRTRVLPLFGDFVQDVSARIFPCLNKLSSLRSLHINGSLDLRETSLMGVYPGVTHLRVTSLAVSNGRTTQIRDFLMSFPNLEHLHVSTTAVELFSERLLPLSSLKWHKVSKVSIEGLWATEHELVGFVEQNRLQSLELTETCLVEGSWRSCFDRIYNLSNKTVTFLAFEFEDGDVYSDSTITRNVPNELGLRARHCLRASVCFTARDDA